MTNKLKISNGMNLRKVAIWMLMALSLTPFIVVQNLITPYIAGKTIFLRMIAFFVFLAITILLFKTDSEEIFIKIKRLTKDWLFIALSVNIFLLGISTVFAFDRSVAFFGEVQRNEGFLTIFSIYSLYVPFRILFTKSEWKKFFVLVSSASITLFFIEFMQMLSGVSRPDALSGNPDFLAIQYLFSIFAGLMLYQYGVEEKRFTHKILGVISSVFAVLGVMISQTRGPLLGLLVAILFCFLLISFIKEKRIFDKHNLHKVAKYICIGIIGVSLLIGVTYRSNFWHKVPGVNRMVETRLSDGSMMARILHVKTSVGIFESSGVMRAMLGYGWDNYSFAWGKYYDPKVFFYDPAFVDRAHNKIMDLLVMTGLLGLMSYVLIWFFVIRKIVSLFKRDDATRALIFLFFSVAYLVSLQFIFDTPMTMFAFIIVLAYLEYVCHGKE